MPATRFAARRATSRRALLVVFWVALGAFVTMPRAAASGDAPQWMHALVGATLPAYDDKTDAVLLYSDTNVTVLSADKIIGIQFAALHGNRREKILPATRNPASVGFKTCSARQTQE